MGALANLKKNLGAASPRSKLLLPAIIMDILFLIFMAVSAAGPLANKDIYWGKYADANIPQITSPADFLTGIWGNCIVISGGPLAGSANCAQWANSPAFVRAYGSAYFGALAAMQVLAGSVVFFGCIMVAFTFNPVPLLVSGIAATLFYVPTFSMMQWVNTDLAKLVSPYQSYSNGPALGLGATALALTCLSLVLKVLAMRASAEDRYPVTEEAQGMKSYA